MKRAASILLAGALIVLVGDHVVRADGYSMIPGGGAGGGGPSEHDFSAHIAGTNVAPFSFSRTIVTNSSTLTNASTIAALTSPSGTGTFTVKLCSDGTSCAGGNVYLTCSITCNLVSPGDLTACTVTKAAVSAATTLTWATTAQCTLSDPTVNVVAHLTTP